MILKTNKHDLRPSLSFHVVFFPLLLIPPSVRPSPSRYECENMEKDRLHCENMMFGTTPGYGGYTSDYKKNKRSKTHSGDGAAEGGASGELRKIVEKSRKMEEEFGQKMTEMKAKIDKLTKEAKRRDLEHAKQLTKMRADVARVKKGDETF